MAKDLMSKYVKSGSIRKRPLSQKSNSWLSNAVKSVGLSSYDVLKEIMPSTVETVKATAAVGTDVANSLISARSSERTLKSALSKNFYMNLGKDILKNSLEDLKSGKFYNQDRTQQLFDSMNDMDMGDMDFDFGDDENFDTDEFDDSIDSADGMAHASFSRKKGKNNEVTNIMVGTDLGPDSTLVRATEFQTETSVNVGKAVIDSNRAGTQATLTMLGGMRNEITASLSSISDNLSTVAGAVSETLSQHVSLSAKYYEDSIGIQTQILEHLKNNVSGGSTKLNTREFKQYDNVMDMVGSDGGFDFNSYKDLVKKQANRWVDNNMFASQIKFMNDNRDSLLMTAASPLQKVLENSIKGLIPKAMQLAMGKFDEQLKEVPMAALNQVSGLQRSDNPFLSALGSIFGVQNKITISKVDKSAYNKGAMSWTGLDHQALTNVIPTLLRKIYASVSGEQEIDFDYGQGIFRKVKDMEEEAENDRKRRETSGFSEYKSQFKEFTDKIVAGSKEEKAEYSENFEKFLSKLVKDTYGGRTFRLGGRDGNETDSGGYNKRDDIKELLGKSSSDDKNVQVIRAYMKYLKKTNPVELTKLFGSKVQEQRAYLDRTNREIQEDPTKFNTKYTGTGLKTDTHLKFAENDKSKVAGVKNGIGAGVTDKYGRNSNYYLREILNTLSTGIYVLPLSGMSGSDNNDAVTKIQNTRKDNLGILESDKEKANKKDNSNKTRPSNYSDEKRQKDIETGKVDMSDDNASANLDAAVGALANEENTTENEEDKSFLGKIMGKIPSDSGLGRILGRLRNTKNKAGEAGTGIFNTLNKALFDVVFGDGEGRKGSAAIFNKAMGVLKSGFGSFATFLDNKIFKPLDEALFGEDGFVKKLKESDFGKKISETFKDLKSKASSFLLGDLVDGKRTGGLFSETANSLKDMGTHVKEAILGKKGAGGKPLPLDQDDSVMGNMKRIFKSTSENIGNALGIEKSNEPIGTRLNNVVNDMSKRFSERATEWSNNIFGRKDENGKELNEVFNSEFAKKFKEDMKGQKGYIGATSAIGLLSSFFLPGGPIGGALVGAGVGIVSKSTGLKDLLFGKEENGERTGGLINKEVQNFFKDNKTGLKIGAIGGLASSVGLLPSFFFPGGPIGGALLGTSASLIAKSGALNTLLYGEGGTKDDPTGGLMANFKKVFGKNKDFKKLGLDAGIGAGVGLLGSFFLPGGPLINAMLGSAISVGTASDKFRDWFFGKEGDDGKRSGGIFNKFSDYMKENIFTPLTTSVKIAQNKIVGFVKENMVAPFQVAIDPLIKEAKYVKDQISKKVSDVFDSLKEAFHKTVVKPIGDTVDKYLVKPIKNTLTKLFSGIGKAVGTVIAAPFKMIASAGRIATTNQVGREADEKITKIKDKYNPFGEEQTKWRKKFGVKMGLTGSYIINPDTGEREKVGKGVLGQFVDYNKRVGQAEKDKRTAVKSAGEDYDNRLSRKQAKYRIETELNDYRIRNGLDKLPKNNTEVSDETPNSTTETKVDTSTVTDASTKKVGKSKKSKLSKKKNRKAARKNRNQKRNKTSNSESIDSIDDSTRVSVGDDLNHLSNEGDVYTEQSPVSHEDTAKIDTKSKTQTTDNYKPETPTGTGIKINTGNTRVKTGADTTQSSSGSRKSSKIKDSGSILSDIQKDVSKISDSVYGQLNGVGSNVNKIYKLLLKQFGKKDDDIQGDNNKEHVGFFGKLRTAFNNPIKAIQNLITSPFKKIKSIITAPFKKIADIGHSFVTKVKNIGSGLANAGKSLIKGIGTVGKSLLSGLGSLAKGIGTVAVDVIHTGLTAVRAALPAIGEAVKGVASVITDGLKIAGTALVSGVKTVGNFISGAAKGFGQLLGGAMSGLGSLLSVAGLIGKDVLKGAWNGLKFAGGKALSLGKSILSAPFKKMGKGKGLNGKGPIHVIVDSGMLDRVKLVDLVKVVEIVKHSGDSGEGSSGGGDIGFDYNTGIFSRDGETRVGTMPMNLQFFAEHGGSSNEDKSESKLDNAVDNFKTSVSNAKTKIANAGRTIRDKLKRKDDAERASQVQKGSRESLLSRLNAKDEKDEEGTFKTKMLSLLGRTADASEEHKTSFIKTFDLKKGLITAGVLLLAPYIIKFFKKLDIAGLISSLAKDVSTGYNEVGGISGIINNVTEGIDQIKDIVKKQDTHYAVDKDGNLVYDENGKLVEETTKSNRIKEALMPTRTRINTETGEWENNKEWTNQSDTLVNFAGHRAIKAGKVGLKIYETGKTAVNAAKAVGSGVAKAGKAVVNFGAKHSKTINTAVTATSNAVSAGKNLVKTGATKLATGAKTVGSTAVNTAKSVAKTSFEAAKGKVKTAVTDAATSDGVVGKAITMMQKALEFLVSKFTALGQRYGVKIGEGALSTVLKSVKGIFSPAKLKGFADKIGNFIKDITKKSSVAAGTLALAEIGFALYGAIDGACNAGALFEVDSKAVDAKMRAIAGVFKGLLNTSIGSWVDLINSLVYEILGFNFVKTIASHVYKLLSNDKDDAKLEEAQAQFTADYEATVEQEYAAYVESTEAQGQTPMSFEDFKASDLVTTRSEYNSSVNKSLAKRVVDGVQGIGKGIKNAGKTVVNVVSAPVKAIGKVGSSIVNGAKNLGKTAVSKVKSVGSNFINGVKDKVSKVKDFGSSVVDKAKNVGKTAVSVVKKDIENVKGFAKTAAKTTGKFLFGSKEKVYYTPQGSYYVKNGETYDYYSATGSKIGTGFDASDIESQIEAGTLTEGTKEKDGVLTPAVNLLKTAKTSIVNTFNTAVGTAKQVASNFVSGTKALGDKALTAVKNSATGKAFTKFFIGTTTTVYYDTNGNYYKLNGETYDYYDAKGSKIAEGIPTDDVNTMITNGQLVSGEITEQSTVGKIKDGIKSVGTKLSQGFSSLVDTTKTKVSNLVSGAKNLASKALESAKNTAAGKALRKFFVGTSETRYYDTNGNYYVKNGETYDYYDAKGSKIAEGIDSDTFATKFENGELVTKEVSEQSTIGEIKDSITSFGTKIATGFKDAIGKRIEFAQEVGTKALNLASNALTSIKENGFTGAIAKFFSKKTDKGYFDMKGNYYVRQSDGTYKYFNGNGDEIASDIPESEITQMLEDGLLTEGEVQTGDSEAKEAVNKMKSAISSAWSSAKDTVSNAWDSFKSWLGGKGGEEITESITTGGGSGGKGGKTRVSAGGKGGSGEELNGMPYYSQNDPKYRDKPYKEIGGRGSDDTIGERGCGPTAMAMVASKITGKNYDPTTMAHMAEVGGYSTSVGTTPGYFGAAANALGIESDRSAPTPDNLTGSLANGNSVILQGVRNGDNNSPYTSEGHYVTATGIDGDTVIVNDPRGREYSGAYKMSDVLNDTVGMWSFGGKGGKFGTSRPNTYTNRPIIGGFGTGTSADKEKWLNIVREVKKAIAAQSPGYSQSNWIKITVGGKTLSVRTDCSGYVAACLKFFGVLGDSTNLTSSIITNKSNKSMLDTGFTPGGWPGWDSLQEGDIISRNGHVEIFAYNKDGKHYVYNCGSDSSVNSASPTITGHSAGYDTVWRCGPAGTGVVEGAASIDSSSGDSSTSSGSSSSGGVSSFMELLSGAASAFSNSIMKGLGFKVDDSSSTTGTDTGSNSSGSSTENYGGSVASNLTGSDTTQKIWNYLTKTTGLDKYAASGLMGCWQAESSNNPDTFEGYYLQGAKNMGGVDAILASNTSMNKYTTDVLFPAYAKSGININKSAYKGTDGNYYPGFGLAQWTGPRGEKLVNWSKSKGADWKALETQLGYVDYELKNNLRGSVDTYNGTGSVEDGTMKAMKLYEGNTSTSYYNKRLPYAKQYYNLYAGGSGGNDGGKPIKPASEQIGGFGTTQREKVSTTTNSMQSESSANVSKIIMQNNTAKSMMSDDASQLLNAIIGYLSQIVDNTGATNSELEALNNKDFGSSQTTNNTINNSSTSYNGNTPSTTKSADTPDRSKYQMAKRVAAGILT